MFVSSNLKSMDVVVVCSSTDVRVFKIQSMDFDMGLLI